MLRPPAPVHLVAGRQLARALRAVAEQRKRQAAVQSALLFTAKALIDVAAIGQPGEAVGGPRALQLLVAARQCHTLVHEFGHVEPGHHEAARWGANFLVMHPAPVWARPQGPVELAAAGHALLQPLVLAA